MKDTDDKIKYIQSKLKEMETANKNKNIEKKLEAFEVNCENKIEVLESQMKDLKIKMIEKDTVISVFGN